MTVMHLVLNQFVNDQRVLRAAKLSRRFGETWVLALHRDGLSREEEQEGCRVRRFALRTRGLSRMPVVQLIKYAEATARMAAAAARLKPALVHAHDLNALPIGYLAARWCGARLVYDAHEYWRGASSMRRFPRWMRAVASGLEGVLARRTDAAITVSEPIADTLARELRIPRPVVVRNVPERPPDRDKAGEGPGPLRAALEIPAGTPVVLYQGGMSAFRGLFVLLEAFARVAQPAVLVFLGDGPEAPALRARAAALGLGERVRFHPAVPAHDLHRWTRDATIGCCPTEGGFPNHDMALANKLFEYIQAGVPLLVSDLPAQAALVQRHGVGEVFPDGDVIALAACIDGMLADPERIARYRAASVVAARELHWGHEQEVLADLYQRLLVPPARG